MRNLQALITRLKTQSSALPALIIFLAGVLLYLNTINNQLFWDDNDFILNNQYIQNWQHYPKVWQENILAGIGQVSNYYRPILLSVFSLQWHLWGDLPAGYHITNLLMHSLNGVLLFLLFKKLFKSITLAFFPALIFIVHPLQTEAVSYANSLGDSLSVFFILLGLHTLFISSKARPAKAIWFIVLTSAFYTLAQLSKETAIVFGPLAFLVLTIAYLNSRWQISLEAIIKRLLPLFILSITYLFLRAGPLNFDNSFNLYNTATQYSSSISIRLYTFTKIFLYYIGLFFWPQHLHMEREVSIITNPLSPWVITGSLIFTTLITAIYMLRQKLPAASFGIAWFLIGLVPVSNVFVPINGMIYEHWLYMPLAGLGLALTAALKLCWQKLAAIRPLIVLLVIISIASLSLRTVMRNAEWRTAIGFYKQTLSYNPNSYRIWNNLAMEYAEKKQYPEAIDSYSKAINLSPSNPIAYYNLANIYRDTGQSNLAIINYEKALKADPKFYYTYPNLILMYQAANKPAEAERVYKQWQKVSQ